MRAAMCVIVRDLIVFGVISDMMKGRPAVYATFSSYDEVAHHSGLERADTLEALRKLDQQFGRIERARRYAPRPYEIVVLSDHGQTQGATFKQRNGYTLADLVNRSLVEREGDGARLRRREQLDGRPRGAGGDARRRERGRRRRRGAAERGGGARLGQPRARLPDGGAAPADARGDRGAPPAADPGAARASARRLRARALGGARARRARRRAARTTSPTARSRARTRSRTFSPNAPKHLLRTDGFPHVADLMVNSFYDPQLDEGCAFEELISFHGGLGGPQTRAFILHPAVAARAGGADRRRGAGARGAQRLAARAARSAAARQEPSPSATLVPWSDANCRRRARTSRPRAARGSRARGRADRGGDAGRRRRLHRLGAARRHDRGRADARRLARARGRARRRADGVGDGRERGAHAAAAARARRRSAPSSSARRCTVYRTRFFFSRLYGALRHRRSSFRVARTRRSVGALALGARGGDRRAGASCARRRRSSRRSSRS